MPKKKNFLGGMQNYNAETGEYEPALVGSNGERPSSFKSFKKEDSEFKKTNDKRIGKDRFTPTKLPEKGATVKIDKKFGDNDREFEVVEVKDGLNGITIKEKGRDGITYNVDVSQLEGYNNGEPLDGKVFNKSEFENYNDKRLGKNVNSEATNESDDEEGVGKIIKYQPFLRDKPYSNTGSYGEDVRAKKLNNGLAMETKKSSKSHTYFGSTGQYKLVDIESGLSVGWANSYEEALKKSKDKDFIGAVERARKIYWEKYPDRKRTQEKPEEKKSEPVKKLKDEASKKEMDKARKKMEKFWAKTDANEHMRSEMDYLLSNFEHDNGKEYALEEAKRNIQKWQRVGYLDTNEMRDEKLVYFQKMVEYMEKNM